MQFASIVSKVSAGVGISLASQRISRGAALM